ncbi:MAG: nitroreductase [Lachnospiraceae bacterium]|nr:nitroreductase [Lachnospiraceae bacterium]
MDLLQTLLNRRSVRTYKEEPISAENMKKILYAGLLSPSGRNKKPWEFVVVQNKDMLVKMSESRIAGAGMLSGAAAAIVVLGDEEQTDVWTEDCSIAMSNMHLMASSLGVGSCWIQGRLREASEGVTTENFLRDLLGFPENMRLEAMLSLGIPEKEVTPHTLEEAEENKIHWEKY